jgi:hypothetical protein
MGRLLDAAVTADPTAGVHRLPQPFRMIDKILSGVVDDAADKAVARERRRLARLGIVEGTKMYRPVAETVELEHAATCVCVARFEDDEAERAERATGDARTAREARATRETEDDEDENATSTSRPRVVVFAGDEDGCVLAVDAATGAVLGRVAAFPGRAIAAVTAATVAPPPPEDETFWRANETNTRKEFRDGDASADRAPNEDDEDAPKEDAPKEEDAEEKDRKAEEEIDGDKIDPLVPLFDIAAAAGGPTPRDATQTMIVAAACADAARLYTFDASSTRFTPLCAAPTPAGSTPASLLIAPDGRTLALAAGGGALAAYEVPPPKPDAFLPASSETNADEASVDADGETTSQVVPDDVEGDENAIENDAFGSGLESQESGSLWTPAQTHEDGAFAAATPLVWLEAARAAAAFGAAPVRAPGERADVSAGDEEGADATDATDAEPSAADAEEQKEGGSDEKEDGSEAGDAATKTLSSRPDEPRAGAPDAYFRLDAAGRADALLAAWPGCNRAAMFSVRGALDALSVAAHRHDTVPALRGECDAKTEAPAEDDAAEPEPEPEPEPSPADDDAEAASAAYSTPACDWTTPFPVTASAAVSDGEVSLFALGLVDGTVLVIDARLGVVAARLDRLGAVAPRGTSQGRFGFFPDGRDGDARLSRDAFGDGDGPQFFRGANEKTKSLPSLTACVALAFAHRDETCATVELTAASAEGWTATYAFPNVAPGALGFPLSSFPKNPPASRLARPRGDPHIAASLTCQRGGPFAVVEGDAPDTRRRSDEDDEDASGSESERDDGVSSDADAVEKKTFMRLMDVTGALTDLYGVFCPPERCAFALDQRGRTILCFDGSNTAVAVSRERRETINSGTVAEEKLDDEKASEKADDATEPAERPSGETSGEDDPAALDPLASEADPPVCVTHTTHTKLCVYAVPRGVHAQSSPAETAESVFFSSRLDGDGVVSARTSPKRSFSPGKAPDAHGADVGISSRRWQTAASAARLARILSARGGPEARRERFPKRLAELERKFERRAAEGGRPRSALSAH